MSIPFTRSTSFRFLRKLHFYIALPLLLPLVVLSLTGAVLVYGPELQRLVSPEATWSVPQGARPLPVSAIISKVAEGRPDSRIWALTLSDDPDTPYRAWLADGGGVITVNQYTGEILHHFFPKDTFEGWVTALHRRWLTTGETAKWVRHGVSAVALLLVLEVITGLFLWLILPRPLRRLGMSKRFSFRVNVMRLHQLTGVLTALLLILIAFTGMSFYWSDPTRRVIEFLTQGTVYTPAPPKDIVVRPLGDLEDAITLAAALVPEGKLKSVRPPAHRGKPAVITMKAPQHRALTQLWVGDDPVRLLYIYDGGRGNLATFLWRLRYPLHVGTFAGPWMRPLWIILALAPVWFVISGIWLYARRR